MSQLDQIQITFVAVEDRLLLRVTTTDGKEYRAWLTRRLVGGLLPLLHRGLVAQPRIQTQASPLAQQELLRFEHERAMAASDFKTPLKADTRELPLGPAPLLITRCQVRPQADGALVMALAPEQGAGIDLALNPQLQHSIVSLFDQALKAADWALPAPGPAVATPTPTPEQPTIN